MAVNRLRVTGPISASNEPNDLAIVACLREYGQIVGTGLQIRILSDTIFSCRIRNFLARFVSEPLKSEKF